MAEFIAAHIGHIVTLSAALIGSWGIFWKASRDSEKEHRQADILDRSQFRTDLMNDIAELRKALAECHAQHLESQKETIELQKEIVELRLENRRALAEIASLRDRIDHLEQE